MLLRLPMAYDVKEVILACVYIASKLPFSHAAAFYACRASPKPTEINTATPLIFG